MEGKVECDCEGERREKIACSCIKEGGSGGNKGLWGRKRREKVECWAGMSVSMQEIFSLVFI